MKLRREFEKVHETPLTLTGSGCAPVIPVMQSGNVLALADMAPLLATEELPSVPGAAVWASKPQSFQEAVMQGDAGQLTSWALPPL